MKFVEVVGEGTFGVVHKAIWCGTVVAAKVISVPCGSEDGVIKEIEMCRYAIREHTMALCNVVYCYAQDGAAPQYSMCSRINCNQSKNSDNKQPCTGKQSP